MPIRFHVLALGWVTSLGLAAQSPGKTHRKIGDLAPGFALPFTTGKAVRLSEFRGKRQLGLDKLETADTQAFGVSAGNSHAQMLGAAASPCSRIAKKK